MTNRRVEEGTVSLPNGKAASVRSAKGAKGVLYEAWQGQPFFRLYFDDGGFSDFPIEHTELGLTITDDDSFFYITDDHQWIDHAPATYGRSVISGIGREFHRITCSTIREGEESSGRSYAELLRQIVELKHFSADDERLFAQIEEALSDVPYRGSYADGIRFIKAERDDLLRKVKEFEGDLADGEGGK